MNKITSFFVAGLKFHKHKEIEGLKSETRVHLIAELDNPYDGKAIKILADVDGSFYMIGYVPKEQTYTLHNYRVEQIPIKATLVSYNKAFPDHKAALIVVESEQLLEENGQVDFINV